MSLVLLALPYTAGVAASDPNAAPAISNLEFRAAAFDLFRQRYFSSLMQLLQIRNAASTVFAKEDDNTMLADYFSHEHDSANISEPFVVDRLSNALLSKPEADVVIVDLYLALGMPNSAEQLMQKLNGKTSAAKRSWLTLARSFYRRGYLQEAEQALTHVGVVSQGELMAERDALSALVLMARQRDQDAIAVLKKSDEKGQSDRLALEHYNLGLAFLDSGNIPAGAAMVGRLDEAAKDSPAYAPLRDLANINLGYAMLAQNNLDQAGGVLQEAMHSDLYGNYALLAAGWVNDLKGDQRKALANWLPLIERDPGDEAVQEGLLAVPYAYSQLQDYAQAQARYQHAIDTYQKELTHLHNTRPSLMDGALLDALLKSNAGGKEFDAQWSPGELPASLATPYILPTLASHRFQEGLKNYRDLLIARDNLLTAGTDIDASLSVLAKQREAYTTWQSQAKEGNKDLNPTDLSAHIKELRDELTHAEATHDVMALATVKQIKLLSNLKEASRLLDIVKSYIVDYDDLYDKYRLLNGLMRWDMTEQYPARLQEVKQQLQELEQAMNQASKNRRLLTQSDDQINTTMTKRESAYKALRTKQIALAATIQPLLDEQKKYLETQLTLAYESGEKKLAQYLVQARLGAAQTSDRLAGTVANKDYGPVIAAYQTFLDQSGESPYRRDVMFRLAYLKMLQADIRDTDPHSNATQVTKNNGDALYDEAIAVLAQLLKTYPNNPDNDRVLYNLAKAYDHRGETDALLDSLDRLSKDYPRSAYSDEIQFRRGELLFSLGLPAQAAEAYSAITAKGSDSPYYEKALYKLSWSHYKEGRYQAAVDVFLSLLDRKLSTVAADSNKVNPNVTRSEEELINDILRGTVLSVAQLKGAQSLTAYFTQHGARPYEYRLYETLAQLYLEQQRIEDAANVYRSFVAQYPNHPQAPSFDSRVITTYEKGGFIDLLQAAKEDFVNRYEPAAAYWKNNPGSERGAVLDKVREYLHELTRYAHAKAQQTKVAADYQQAEHWYRLFLQSFPNDPQAAETHFLFGDILFEDRRYADAAQEYQKVAYEYKDDKQGAEAAYAAAIAQDKIAAGLSGAPQQAAVQQSLLALQRFADTYPKDPRAPAALMKAAQEWFSQHDRARAQLAAQHLLDMKPEVDKDLRRNAWAILGHSAFEEQRYADAEQRYRQVLALMAKDDDKRHAIEENLAAAIYKQGEQARANGDLRGAVQHFLRIADLAPAADINATAQYDAAAALLALEDWPAAIRLLERFRVRYPDNPLQKEIAPKLAVAYQKVNDWPKAAAELESIATQGEGSELKRDAVWQSAELYLRAAQPREALRMFQTYVSRFPNPVAERVEAQQRIADLYEQQKNTERQHYWLQQIIDSDKHAGAERSDRTRLLAGRAALVLADDRYHSFTAIQLTHPLKKSLKLKKKAMEEALAAYRAVGDYGIAEITTAATFRAAQIYSELGKAIMASQRPKGLSALELEQYNVLLEEQAYPFEEQAITLFEVNAHRTADNVYDDWVKKSFAALSKLLPGRYAKTEKGEAYVDAIY
jgi:tetratricopeptide (TPR) repeat protein